MWASDGASTRSLSDLSDQETLRPSTDLVAAARRNLCFLRLVAESPWLRQRSILTDAVRRYDELWMPLISDLSRSLGSVPPMILPPLDIEWVWFCHTLNPAGYRQYCESRFCRIIGKPTIFDEQNEVYALNRCRDIWIRRYSSEPFEIETYSSSDSIETHPIPAANQQLLNQVLSKQVHLERTFSEPYLSETVYLVAARQRYKGFLYMIMNRFTDGCPRLVPSKDILLMWVTHMSYPTVYATDMEELEGEMEKVVKIWEEEEEGVEESKKTWERIFDQPYEKAGGEPIGRVADIRPPFYWDVTETDVNQKYKSMVPRFLLEVFVTVKMHKKVNANQGDMSHEFLRLRVVRCHRELKLDKPVAGFHSASWQKVWHLYCEFGTRGIVVELRRRRRRGGVGFCSRGSSSRDGITFLWNDLLRAPSVAIGKEIDQRMRVVASITPPVQAPYLLKCVPDRVTDDSGAMISDVILRLNRYRPQEGRWLSRTVLDHAGRDCFVVRMRIGEGFWRRGGEKPSAVKWEDRIIEVREGSWSYVAGSIGRAPEKVVGTAKPKQPPEGFQAAWELSTGDDLLIRGESSGFSFDLKNQTSTDSMVKLLRGRQMQYQAQKLALDINEGEGKTAEEEEEFVTLIRYSEENPIGRATALINWKLLAAELLPEEDAVLVLLLCMSIIRSITEMKKEDVGSLLIRRRLTEARLGDRDLGSVILHPPPPSSSSSISSPHLQTWYWNPGTVISSGGLDHTAKQPAVNSSPAEGGTILYQRGITG